MKTIVFKKNLKTDTNNIMERATSEGISLLETNADEIYSNVQPRHRKKKDLHKDNPSVAAALLNEETWKVKEVAQTDIDGKS